MKASSQCLSWAMMCVMVLSAASCEKMNIGDATSGEERPNVRLRVGSVGLTPFSSTRATAADVSTRLNFALYDTQGARVKQVNQKEGDENYGTPSFYAAEGHYLLVALAHSSNGNPTMTDPQKVKFTNAQGYTDTFLYADSLIVGEKDVDRELSLHRIVSMVRFMVDTPIPEGTSKIQFYYTGGAGTFSALTGYGSVNSKQSVMLDVAGTEQQFEIYTIPHAERDTLEVLVTTYDAHDSPLTKKTIAKVPIQRNRITVCHGNLFDEQAEGTRAVTFTMGVDDAWGDELPMQF